MYKVILSLTIALAVAGSASAAQVIYPAKGQSPEQQKKDEAECSTWAIGNSGYDPAKPAAAPKANAQPSTPSGARLRGAARGAIIGEVAGGDTGDAAIAGAVLGGARARRQKANAQAQAEASAAAKQKTNQANYDKARAACLEGKGYSVK
jgi:hypothetical protein